MNQATKAVTLASIAVLSWSTVATSFKIALRELSVYEMLLVSSITALLIFTVWLTVRGEWKELKRLSFHNWMQMALLGLINPVAYYLILFKSYSLLPAQIAQPINYIWPIALLILIAAINRRPIPLRKYIGMFVSLGGLTIISMGGRSIEGTLSTSGITLGVISAILWAIYWLLNDRIKESVSESVSLFLGFLFGSAYLCIGTLIQPVNVPSIAGIMSGAYIGVFEMGIPFLCFGVAIRITPNPALINQMCYLAPFLSLFFISMILGEPIMPTTYIGLALIISGILFNQYFVNKPTHPLTVKE